MKRMIIVGSPRSNGRSAHLAEMLFEACIDECPDDELSLAPISELDIAPCEGCGACEASEGHTCAIEDDMSEIRELLDEVDELTVVSPVYFSGAPSQLKALLDRIQPYYWTWDPKGERRPMTLHVVGEGGDPNGFDALVSEVRSAGAVAGFTLERIVDWVGKIDESGEITSEGDEYVPEGAKVEFVRINADDIESIHVAHEENLKAARKAAKKERAEAKKAAEAAATEPDATPKRAQLSLYGDKKSGSNGRNRGQAPKRASKTQGNKQNGKSNGGSAANPGGKQSGGKQPGGQNANGSNRRGGQGGGRRG